MPTPSVTKPMIEEPMQRVTPANAVNLSDARQTFSAAKEPIVFMTCFEVEAMLKKENEKASSTS